MYPDWRKTIKRLVITGFLFSFGLNFVSGQTNTKSPSAKSESIAQSLGEAAAAFSGGDLSFARKLLQKILIAAPENAAAHALAGIVADREGNLPAAERHLAKAARLQPKSPEMRNNYGAILLRLNRKNEAAKEFLASLAVNSNQRSALVNLAQIRFDENNLTAARDLFEKAENIQPDAEIKRALVIISLRLKDTERAKKEFQSYFISAKDITNQADRGELATLLLENDLVSEAIQDLEAAINLDQPNPDLLVLLSRAYLRQKNIKSAGKLLESAVARGFVEAKIYAALAEVYEAAGYFENAIPAMRRAIEKDSQNEFYHARYGLLLVDAKAPAAAAIRLNEAVREFPNSARLFLALGIAQMNDNKTAEARAAFERALTIDPKLIPALAYSAMTFTDQARYEESLKIYERGLALDDKNAVLHYLLADTLLKTTSPDVSRIENALKKAIALDAKLAQAHLALGRLYVRQERWTEAAASLENAAKLDLNHSETFYQLGRVYARLKRAEDSRAALAKFKQITDNQKERRENERRELVRRLANVRF
jgi:Tfp pilus assembly protein PilF